jgi:hypothetical protein
MGFLGDILTRNSVEEIQDLEMATVPSNASFKTQSTPSEATPSTPTPARNRVLASPELLESILLHLPLLDLLLRIPLVCEYFHAATLSARIQQALFLLPTSSLSPLTSTPNPLLHCPHATAATFVDQRTAHFTSQPRPRSPLSFLWAHPDAPDEALPALTWPRYAARYRAYNRKDASWRRMLVVQPPVRELEMRHGQVASGNVLVNESGVRMAQLENVPMDWGHFWVGREGRGVLVGVLSARWVCRGPGVSFGGSWANAGV